jgi:citrate lyase subunit beta/citryl-CoA lyase
MNRITGSHVKRRLPVWRSLFCVPVTNDKFVENAHTRGADAIVLDLEDGVALGRKDEARKKVPAAAEKVARGGVDILVRINRPWRMALRDLEAVISPLIGGLVLPKVANANHIQVLSEIVGELEKEHGIELGKTKFFALVETAEAYPRMEEIACADPRVIAMCLGVEDFSASCGMLPEADGLYVPKMQMLVMARAAGILPLGTLHSIADYKDLDGWRDAALRARRLGYRGAVCIHPGQIPILNEAFSPTPQEIDQATRIVDAAALAEKSGTGACEVDGKMVDWPVVERAREIIENQEAILAAARRIKL